MGLLLLEISTTATITTRNQWQSLMFHNPRRISGRLHRVGAILRRCQPLHHLSLIADRDEAIAELHVIESIAKWRINNN